MRREPLTSRRNGRRRRDSPRGRTRTSWSGKQGRKAMHTKPFLVTVAMGAAALVLAPACSEDSGMAGPPPGDDQFFVPAGLPNTSSDTGGGWLTLVAFTLVQEVAAPALYVAVRNDGAAPACNVGMLTDFFDKAGYPVTSAGAAVWSRQTYRLDPDSDLQLHRPRRNCDGGLDEPAGGLRRSRSSGPCGTRFRLHRAGHRPHQGAHRQRREDRDDRRGDRVQGHVHQRVRCRGERSHRQRLSG